jgi:TolA-binding protein
VSLPNCHWPSTECSKQQQIDEARARIAELENLIRLIKEDESRCIEQREAAYQRIAELNTELALAHQAMACDDERLRVAAERVGIVAGCDAPDEMADEIEALRNAAKVRQADSESAVMSAGYELNRLERKGAA